MQPKASILNITKLIFLLSSTVEAILPVRIQFRYLKQEQILTQQKKGSYSVHVTLGSLARDELLWWMINLKLCNRMKIQQWESHIIIQTDALKLNSHLPKTFFIYLNDNLSRMMKNAFYFILKSLFVLKIFKVLSLLFGHLEKTVWLEG